MKLTGKAPTSPAAPPSSGGDGVRFLAPLSRKETIGLLLIGVAILGYLLVRYGRFVDWGIW